MTPKFRSTRKNCNPTTPLSMKWKEKLKDSRNRFRPTRMRSKILILGSKRRLSPLMERCSRVHSSSRSSLKRRKELFNRMRESRLKILVRPVGYQRERRNHSIRLKRTKPIR